MLREYFMLTLPGLHGGFWSLLLPGVYFHAPRASHSDPNAGLGFGYSVDLAVQGFVVPVTNGKKQTPRRLQGPHTLITPLSRTSSFPGNGASARD